MTSSNGQGPILLTGGAGFIGSHLVDRLLERGDAVVCVDNFDPFYDPAIKEANLAEAQRSSHFTLVRGDILDQDILRTLFARHGIQRVVHLAALAGVRPSLEAAPRYIDVDVKGTVHLLELARLHRVRQFVFASSSSVYGASPNLPYNEDASTLSQVSPYGAAKRAAELYCHTYHHLYGTPITALRFFTVYGPRQRPEMGIHKFTRLLSRDQPVSLYGDGSSARDYTYIDDVVDGVMAALERPMPYEVINLGSSRPVRLLDLVQVVATALGVPAAVQHLPEQPGDVPATWADVSKAERLLGYRPRTSLEEGVGKFIAWYRQHQTLLEGAALP